MADKVIQVTKELTGAWEVWTYIVPDDFDPSLIDVEYEGTLTDSGFECETITHVEEQ